MRKYVISGAAIRHNGKVCLEGEEISLEEEDAKRNESYLIPVGETPAAPAADPVLPEPAETMDTAGDAVSGDEAEPADEAAVKPQTTKKTSGAKK